MATKTRPQIADQADALFPSPLSLKSRRKLLELSSRASHQVTLLARLIPVYVTTETLVVPKGSRHLRDDIAPSRKDVGVVLRGLNKEMQALINKLADTLAVLQVHVAEAAEPPLASLPSTADPAAPAALGTDIAFP
jgi:hypothetical protein